MSDNKEEAQNFDAENSSEAISVDSVEDQADLARSLELTDDLGPVSAASQTADSASEEEGLGNRLPNEIRAPQILGEEEEALTAINGEFSALEEMLTTEEVPDVSEDEDLELDVDGCAEAGSSELPKADASEVEGSKPEAPPKEGAPKPDSPKPTRGVIGFGIAIALLVAYGLLIAIGPLFLPAGLDEASLRPGDGGHLLGTSAHGVDLFYETLRAGQHSLLQATLPALAGLFLIYFALPTISDPKKKDMGSLRRWLIFARLPVTVISLFLSYGFGLYYPRTWVRVGILLFLSLTLWLPEVVVLGRYLYRYRSYGPLQSLYFLGASEIEALKLRYGKPILMAFVASFLRMVRMSFLILSVMPFTMDLVSVPKRADWAMSMLIPMQQGEALFVLDRWPHFVAWCLELLFLSLAIWTSERLADCHPLDNPRQVWTMLDLKMAEDLGLPVEEADLSEGEKNDDVGATSEAVERVTSDGDL